MDSALFLDPIIVFQLFSLLPVTAVEGPFQIVGLLHFYLHRTNVEVRGRTRYSVLLRLRFLSIPNFIGIPRGDILEYVLHADKINCVYLLFVLVDFEFV